MKKKKPDPLKVSFFGMNDRVQKLMVQSLKMLSGTIDTVVVAGIEGQVEIIDLDLSMSTPNLLENRLAQRPIKPIIVLSLHEISSNEIIYIKKPLQSAELLAALKTAKKTLKSQQNANSIEFNTKPEKTIKAEKVSKSSLDTQVSNKLPRKSKQPVISSKIDNRKAIPVERESLPEKSLKVNNVSKPDADLPTAIKRARNNKITDKNEEKSVKAETTPPKIKNTEKSTTKPRVSLDIIDRLANEYPDTGKEIRDHSGIIVKSAKPRAAPEAIFKTDNATKSGINQKIIDTLTKKSFDANKQTAGKRNNGGNKSKSVELNVTPEKRPQKNNITKPSEDLKNSGQHNQKSKGSEQKKEGGESASKTANRSTLQKEIAKSTKGTHLPGVHPENLINKSDQGGDVTNRRKSVRYAFDKLNGYFVVNSLIMRNKRKSIQVLDISSRGAFFQCNSKLKLRAKGELVFDFGSATVYKIPAQINRVDSGSYSLIFKEYNHEICDFLINSGKTFEIKTHNNARTKQSQGKPLKPENRKKQTIR